ncbi:hypothetical protein C0991_004013, partial [Blastosporella zonata]
PLRSSDPESLEESDTDDNQPEPEPVPRDPKRKIWLPSDSEEESFGDAEGGDIDGKWAVEIIGEEVAMNGCGKKPDIRYEAQWKKWTRADGTNVTWSNDLLHEDDIKIWTRKQSEKRKRLAEVSTDIDIATFTDLNVHLTATQYREEAVDEKLKLYAAKPYVNMSELTARNLKEHPVTKYLEGDDVKYKYHWNQWDADGDVVMADDESDSRVSIRSSTRITYARHSISTSTADSRPPTPPTSRASTSASTYSQTLHASSSASSTAVGSPVLTPSTRLPKRSATASTSEFFPSSQAQSSFCAHFPSAKALGKRRTRSPSPPIIVPTATMPLSAKAKGKQRQGPRSPFVRSYLSSEETNTTTTIPSSTGTGTSMRQGQKRILSPGPEYSILVDKSVKKLKPTPSKSTPSSNPTAKAKDCR